MNIQNLQDSRERDGGMVGGRGAGGYLFNSSLPLPLAKWVLQRSHLSTKLEVRLGLAPFGFQAQVSIHKVTCP